MSLTEKPKIIVIVGPTASGKTGLSIKVAKKFNGEIISADSRQVYKQLDVGTEKITKEEMRGVPHHLIDVVCIGTIFTAVDFKKIASKTIETITEHKHLPIVTGGTFFYIDTLLGRVSTPEVKPNPELRAKLEGMNVKSLFSALLKLDKRRATDIDPDNKRRLIRALEVWNVLRHVPKNVPTECPYEVLMIGIETDRNELRARIRVRAEQALKRGLVEETKDLLNSGVTHERLSEIGLEYRVVMEYIDGSLTEPELIQKIEEKNWQYAKRQLMWLKRDNTIEWFPLNNIDEIYTRIHNFLEKN